MQRCFSKGDQMEVQFTSHAIERVCGRLASVVSYGEVQSNLASKKLLNCNARVLIKVLDHQVTVKDPDAINGQVQGNKVYALVNVRDGGCRVDTVALSY